MCSILVALLIAITVDPTWGDTTNTLIVDQDIKIWSCKSDGVNSFLDLAVIQVYAETTYEIIIRSQLNPSQYVSTTSPLVIDTLRLGKTLSFNPFNGPTNPNDWTGPMVDKLKNSCGTLAPSFIDMPFWACNTFHGLHLTPSVCRWDSENQTVGGVEIILKRRLTDPVPIYRCYSNTLRYTLYQDSMIPSVGRSASSIVIYTTNDISEYVETTEGSYALASLIKGQSLSYTVSGKWASYYINDWEGPKVSALRNSCGKPEAFSNSPYWACNNVEGLHLRPDACGWSTTKPTPTGGLTVAIRRTAPFRIVKIYSCTDASYNNLVYPLSRIQQLANNAYGITIMSIQNPNEYVTTSSPNSSVLKSLRAGLGLSWTTVPGQFTPLEDWTGPLVDHLWNSSEPAHYFSTAAYWGSDSRPVLHLTKSMCSWTSNGPAPAGGIGVYLLFNETSFGKTGFSSMEEETLFTSSGSTGTSPVALASIIIGSVIGTILVISLVVVVLKKSAQSGVDENLNERML